MDLLLPPRQMTKEYEREVTRRSVTSNNIGPTVDHKIEHAFWDFPFFFFCLGGWSTTLIAASKTAFTFCSKDIPTTQAHT